MSSMRLFELIPLYAGEFQDCRSLMVVNQSIDCLELRIAAGDLLIAPMTPGVSTRLRPIIALLLFKLTVVCKIIVI